MAAARASRRRLGRSFLGLILCIGCTKVLGIDGDYVTDESPNGGHNGSGGKSGAGGTPGVDGGGSGNTSAGGAEIGGAGGGGTGGSPAGGAGAGNGGRAADAGNCGGVCQAGEKCCSNTCLAPSPLFGCSMTDCTGCTTLPNNATGICTNGACDFECISGYQKQGAACAPVTGGTGGAGVGGAPPVCNKALCPACPAGTFVYTACCQDNGTCGCTFPFTPACFPHP